MNSGTGGRRLAAGALPLYDGFMLYHEPITLRYSDGYEAFGRLWMPPEPKGAALYLHGIQSHGLWFEVSARRLAEAGIAVLLPDRRGSGRNEADRGDVPSVRRWLRDCAECLDELHVRTGLARFHVVGVSWGGKLAMGVYRDSPERVAGLTLIAPGLFPRVDLPFMEKVRVGWSAITARRTLFDIPLNEPELFTATPRWQQFIRSDPLRLRQVTAQFLVASRRLDRYVLGLARLSFSGVRPGCPMHVFLSGQDRIIDNGRTKAFVRRLGWPGREIIEYPQACHTLEFEPAPEPFFADLLQGVDAGKGHSADEGEPVRGGENEKVRK
jgi:alpha-beta hydrolase superfamily lysophospholipase